MNFLLDTCVFAEYQNKRPNQSVISWIDSQAEEALFVSILTIGEIEKGIARLPDSKRRVKLSRWLEHLVHRFDRRIISLDVEILRRWGALAGELEKKGHVLPVMDSLIAATALVHHLTVVTRNEEDFLNTGCRIVNVWM
jgi:toxin FitB